MDEPETQEELIEVTIMQAPGIIKGGFYLDSSKRDRNGLITISDGAGKKFKIHPDRIVSDKNIGSMSIEDKLTTVAACPDCGDIISVKRGSNPQCSKHGEFTIVGTLETKTSEKPIKVEAQNLVDFDELASRGELWINSDRKFDGKTEIATLSLIVGERHTTFNIYNNTYGKKNNKPPIEEMLAGKTGYKVKNLDELREKRLKAGYIKHLPPTP